MILLTKLDGTEFILNSDLIEMVEKTPDTMIRFPDKKHYIVREDLSEIIEKVVEYKRNCNETTFLNRMNVEENK